MGRQQRLGRARPGPASRPPATAPGGVQGGREQGRDTPVEHDRHVRGAPCPSNPLRRVTCHRRRDRRTCRACPARSPSARRAGSRIAWRRGSDASRAGHPARVETSPGTWRRSRRRHRIPGSTSSAASANASSCVGQVGLPGGGVPDLHPGVRADHHAVPLQPGVVAQRGGIGDPALLVRHLVGGAGEEHPAVVPDRLGRHRRGAQRLGDPGELGHREDVEAALLPLGDHHALRELVPELGRQEQPALLVQAGRVGAEEHRRSPPPRRPAPSAPASTALHCTPHFPTVNAQTSDPALTGPLKCQVRRGGAEWGTRSAERRCPGGLERARAGMRHVNRARTSLSVRRACAVARRYGRCSGRWTPWSGTSRLATVHASACEEDHVVTRHRDGDTGSPTR